MGTYVNPGNQAFRRIAGPNYVDKTELIELFNERIGGDESLVCISRPRRFGKSYAAKMLAAYYDRSCDSHDLFDDKLIAKAANYKTHLNQHNVIWLDITGFISDAKARIEKIYNNINTSDQAKVQSFLKEIGLQIGNLKKVESDPETSKEDVEAVKDLINKAGALQSELIENQSKLVLEMQMSGN